MMSRLPRGGHRPDTGVCALLGGEQVAIFRLDDDRVHALATSDPFSPPQRPLARHSRRPAGEPVVASRSTRQPSARQRPFVEDASVRVPYTPSRPDGTIYVEPRRRGRYHLLLRRHRLRRARAGGGTVDRIGAR